jgi:hypothetical protein
VVGKTVAVVLQVAEADFEGRYWGVTACAYVLVDVGDCSNVLKLG